MKLNSSSIVAALIACASLISQVPFTNAQSQLQIINKAIPMQTFLLPLRENDLFYDVFTVISSAPINGPIINLISIAISTDHTVIWYDHWEDGYETDVTAAILSPETRIWGDRNASNGCSPRVLPSNCTDANDVLMAGMTIQIQEKVNIPRSPSELDFDGGDMIQASYPLTITRGAFPTDPGSVLAGATEVLDTGMWGTSFEAPVGQLKTGNNRSLEFWDMSYLFLMAKDNGTIVTFPNGTYSRTLNRGDQIWFPVIMSNAITTNNPVQAHLLTGDKKSHFESRWYSLLPTEAWSQDYLSPVGDSFAATRILIYNPNTFEIKVDLLTWDATTETDVTYTIKIQPKSAEVSRVIPDGSGCRMIGNNDFLPLSLTDTVGAWGVSQDGDGQGTAAQRYEWGFSVLPTSTLTSQVVVGMGFGCTYNQCGNEVARSPIWITPTEDAYIFIDYFNTGNASTYDIKKVRRNADIRIRNNITKDMSGALIFARAWDRNNPDEVPSANLPEVDIAAAWGQDPSVSNPNQAISMDMGTLLAPFVTIFVTKVPSVDHVIPGKVFTWTIRVTNVGQSPIRAQTFQIVDPVLDRSSYVLNSTKYSTDLGMTSIQIPDDTTGTPFPLDDSGILNQFPLARRGDAHEISFQVMVDSDVLGDEKVQNVGWIHRDGTPRLFFHGEVNVKFVPSISVSNNVYLGQNNGASCGTAVDSVTSSTWDAPVTYCFNVTNTGDTVLANTTLQNPLLKYNFTIPKLFIPGESVLVALPRNIVQNLTNLITVYGTPVLSNGDRIDELPIVNASDQSSVVLIKVGNPTPGQSLPPKPTCSPSHPTVAPVPPGGPLDSCYSQGQCLRFTATRLTTNSCSTDGDIQICVEVDLTNPQCTKKGKISHTCVKNNETCIASTVAATDFGTSFGTVEKDDIPDGFTQCQKGKIGDAIQFLFKDGAACQGSATYSNDVVTANCMPRYDFFAKSCTGNGEGVECLWTIIIPNITTGSKPPFPSSSSTPTRQPTSTPSISPSKNPTRQPTVSPTTTPTKVPTFSPTVYPTNVPSVSPTEVPTFAPTKNPTQIPSSKPTSIPTEKPTNNPTNIPTNTPSFAPSMKPTASPTDAPTFSPTSGPTTNPTIKPTKTPSLVPTFKPTASPTNAPTISPTSGPTTNPTDIPTSKPSLSPTTKPTASPTNDPTFSPTHGPTTSPSDIPTSTPTLSPTVRPSASPTSAPAYSPTPGPTTTPTDIPTSSPTLVPTAKPSASPTNSPTFEPTNSPSRYPTDAPTYSPTLAPTDIPTITTVTLSDTPSSMPSIVPSKQPSVTSTKTPVSPITSSVPSVVTSKHPSIIPTSETTRTQSNTPTTASNNGSDKPSLTPSSAPTKVSTTTPTVTLSDVPSNMPSIAPSKQPSVTSTKTPVSPVASSVPSVVASKLPSIIPTSETTSTQSNTPTTASNNASDKPSMSPSSAPTKVSTTTPTVTLSDVPSSMPSIAPSKQPSVTSTKTPVSPITSSVPSIVASKLPSIIPTSETTSTRSNTPTTASNNGSDKPSMSPSSAPTKVSATTPTVTLSDVPSSLPSIAPSKQPSVTSTKTPVSPVTSSVPNVVMSKSPSIIPTSATTGTQSNTPTIASNNGSDKPSLTPSSAPSKVSSTKPTVTLSDVPSSMPSIAPSKQPSVTSTKTPVNPITSSVPSVVTSKLPSIIPTSETTSTLSNTPTTASNNASDEPSMSPSSVATKVSTTTPTVTLSDVPSSMPSIVPSKQPSVTPTKTPVNPVTSSVPSVVTSKQPSIIPVTQSNTPTTASTYASNKPSFSPSSTPTKVFTTTPTVTLSDTPSSMPSIAPSKQPSVASTTTPVSPVASSVPTVVTSKLPSIIPTTGTESNTPTTASTYTSNTPSLTPSSAPTKVSTTTPTIALSETPSIMPSISPSSHPTSVEPPLGQATRRPTMPPISATKSPTYSPTISVTKVVEPINLPTLSPLFQPLMTAVPSTGPSVVPSNGPIATTGPVTPAPTVMATRPGSVRGGEKCNPYQPSQYCNSPCMEDVYQDHTHTNTSLVCRSKEVGLVSVQSPIERTCVHGEMITVDLVGTLSIRSDRYDFGWYIATDGGDALTGTCVLNSFNPTSPYKFISPGSVSWDKDYVKPNDVCGDVFLCPNATSGEHIIVEEFYLAQYIEIKCEDVNNDGFLDFSTCFSWRTNVTDDVCDPKALYPGNNVECDCATYDVDNIIVRPTNSSHSTCV